jgi:hypothetical protein
MGRWARAVRPGARLGQPRAGPARRRNEGEIRALTGSLSRISGISAPRSPGATPILRGERSARCGAGGRVRRQRSAGAAVGSLSCFELGTIRSSCGTQTGPTAPSGQARSLTNSTSAMISISGPRSRRSRALASLRREGLAGPQLARILVTEDEHVRVLGYSRSRLAVELDDPVPRHPPSHRVERPGEDDLATKAARRSPFQPLAPRDPSGTRAAVATSPRLVARWRSAIATRLGAAARALAPGTR